MKKILIRLTAAFIIIAAVFIIALNLQSKDRIDEIAGQMLVEANEIANGDESARERYYELTDALKSETRGQKSLMPAMWLSLGTCAAFSLYLYLTILRPFHKMEKFSKDIAAGNYDIPLEMSRHNVFGAFSWAFDSMREELRTAQRAEQEAKDANKTLVAVLSHDIKTPISSIRACAEGLSSDQGRREERRKRYLDTIMRRSDEVARLTEDLFVHALADMDKLVIEPAVFPLRSFISDFASLIDITVTSEIPEVSIIADEKRLKEIFGNIIENAEKYAPGAPVEMTFIREENQEDALLYCIFSDKGTSLQPEDVPFIFYKFYRGKNAMDKEGSGLGLYIVRYITEKLGGKAYAERTEEGLKIYIGLKVSS
ncbi:MAG: HAMP domain-containing histidine kinase [Peptococcaceae bacterium]|nr:HAMP domain-containing histidine kinase [Peptococcaceae bacterium]